LSPSLKNLQQGIAYILNKNKYMKPNCACCLGEDPPGKEVRVVFGRQEIEVH
jgi:hypothetical protein